MLKTLTVWNFALLEQVEIEFDRGLNNLTGETGAGKSILIDALGAVLGHRLTTDAIRTGCEWLRVEAVFSTEDETALHAFLSEQAIDDADGTLIITRQITAKGKSMILINGCHVTLAVLRVIGEFLIDVHGQNENLALLKTENQFALLDNSNSQIAGLLTAYHAVYHAWRELEEQLTAKQAAAKDYANRIDMLRWQSQEIEGAQLKEHEDEVLEAEIKRLANAEKITESTEQAYALLNGGSDSNGILADIALLKQSLEALGRYDESLADSQRMVEDAVCQLQEVFYNVRDYSEKLEFDPQRLDQLQGRMDTIDKLRKKYGATITAVLQHQQKLQAELTAIENYDDDIADLKAKISSAQEKVRVQAALLTEARQTAAGALSQAIGRQMSALGMPDAKLSIGLSALPEFSLNGADALSMLFSANLGEVEKPLAKVASGGELSRIALAIKAVAAAGDSAPASMVFDEIDTGIGGKTAQMVAERIALVAAYKQVLCITHLPQIACMADVHLYISKSVQGSKTVTSVKHLSAGEQVNEIARMASGMDVTSASLGNAREMIDHAKIKKAQLNRQRNE